MTIFNQKNIRIILVFFLFFIYKLTFALENKKSNINDLPEETINDIKKIFKKHGFNGNSLFDKNNLAYKNVRAKINTISYPYRRRHKCGTSLIQELKAYISRKDPETKKLLKKQFRLSRPNRNGDNDFYGEGIPVKEYSTAHFLLHYVDTTSSVHAVPNKDDNGNKIPDIIENYALIFEECWEKETKYFQREPMSDSAVDPAGNGSYDIYFSDMQTIMGYYDATLAYTDTDPTLNHPVNSPTYIVMDSNYADGSFWGIPVGSDPTEIVKITFAHEFFHAIENSYNAYAAYGDLSFAEACATWMEDIVYDDINDYYNYLSDFFLNPQLTLLFKGEDGDDTNYLFEYGECAFPRYLDIKYGSSIIKETWQYYSKESSKEYYYYKGMSITALRKIFDERGVSFDSILGDFRVANYFVAENYSTNFASKYYNDDEAIDFPTPPPIFKTFSTYPFKKFPSEYYDYPEIQPLGACYLLFNPDKYETTLQLKFEGEKLAKWNGRIIKIKTDNSIEIENFDFSKIHYISNITIKNFDNAYSKIVLVIYIPYSLQIKDFYTNYTFNLTEGIPPGDPENIFIQTLNDSDMKLSWTNPVDSDFKGITIIRNDSTEVINMLDTTNNKIVFEGLDTTFIEKGLNSNKTYYYKIYAYDSSYNFSQGISKNIIIYDTTPPSQITSLKAIDDNSTGKVNLDWSDYQAPKDIFGYAVYYNINDFTDVSSKIPITIVNSSNMSYQVSGLTDNTLYYFAVVPIDKSDNKNNSVKTNSAIPTLDITPPLPVAELVVQSLQDNTGDIELDWKNYIEPKDMRNYRIYFSDKRFDNVENMYYESTITKYSIKKDFNFDQLYYFAVTAIDIIGNENKEVVSQKAIPRRYNILSININTSDTYSVYIDGNYAYSGTYVGQGITKINIPAKKHSLIIQAKNERAMDYYNLIDVSSGAINLNVNLQVSVYPEVFISSNNLVTAQSGLSSPFIADWNNDGKKDMLVGDSDGEIIYYNNIGSDDSPVLENKGSIKYFESNIPIDVGEDAVPFVVDWDNDSNKDLIIGNKEGEIYFCENINNDDNPGFNNSKVIYASQNEKNITPFIIDWDEDRKKDIVFGTESGAVYALMNTGTDNNPAFDSASHKIENISIEGNSAPFFINWNHSGKKDIITGNTEGSVKIYLDQNIKNKSRVYSSSSTTFTSNNIEVKTSGRSKPFVADWNNDNLWDVVIGESNGNINVYYGSKPDEAETNTGKRHKRKFCFITQISGDKNNILSKIRDKFLLNFNYTKKLIDLYYKY